MKILYLTFSNVESKYGLFQSTHNRILNAIPLLEDYKILNICFYDDEKLCLLKNLVGIKPRNLGPDKFEIDGLIYENVWLKRGLFSSSTYWGRLNKYRNLVGLFNEKYLSRSKLSKIIIAANKSDLILSHWGYPVGRIAMLVARFSGTPFVNTYHGSDINSFTEQNSIYRNYLKEIINSASVNIVVSKALYENLESICPNSVKYYSPNGIPDVIIRNNWKKYSNPLKIVFIGSLNRDKRADKLADIILGIEKRTSIKLKFTIIGEGEFKDNISNGLLKASSPIEMLGYMDFSDVLKHLLEADILLLPSRSEGMPLVLLEAIATNTIPIASNAGGVSEILDEDFIVKEFEEDFVNAFCDRVAALITKPMYPTLDIENYSWKKLVEKELSMLKLICKIK